jgi:hypothetical protein
MDSKVDCYVHFISMKCIQTCAASPTRVIMGVLRKDGAGPRYCLVG